MPERASAPRRSDGFLGQHLVVLPGPVRTKARRHPLLRGLLVTDAGYFPQAAGHLVERSSGASTELVILCVRGRGWVRSEGATFALRAGSFVWLRAGRAHAYGADDVTPWSIAWAHCVGEELAAWRDLLGVAPSSAGHVIELPPDRLEEIALDRVHAALGRGYGLHELVESAAALRHALSAIARLGVTRGAARSAHERVTASIANLRRDWARPHRLEELASAANLSPAHYSALFRQLTGFAPIDYLIRLRVQHACRLLDTTDATIAAISLATGYEDPYYFTRCFRRVMGCAPREYRKIPKG